MTIASVTGGDIIDPAWGNSVADQLNLGVIQSGVANYLGNSTTGYGPFYTFPAAFTAPPIIVATVKNSLAASTAGYYVKINDLSATGVRFRHYDTDGFWYDAVPVAADVHWIAFGTLA